MMGSKRAAIGVLMTGGLLLRPHRSDGLPFTETLQEQVDLGPAVRGWVEVVRGTMQPAAVGYWVREE